jgi:carbon-monoxide dehydrogenase large subunit
MTATDERLERPGAAGRGWIGESVRRREDAPLIRGKGRYAADLNMPGQVHMAVLRSPHGHARIRSIDTSRAQALAGVSDVVTAGDLAAVGEFPVLWRLPGLKPSGIPVLASDKVRYVGEPVAAVVADSRYVAEDALELIDVDYDVLPAVTDVEAALAPGAPVINDAWGDNVAIRHIVPGVNAKGEPGDIEGAFAAAHTVVRARFRINRFSGVPLETRGMLASFDPLSEELTLWSESQVAHKLRTQLAEVLAFPEAKIRILTPHMGGGFGVKWDAYPEDALVCILSRRLGRPVKWIEDRREHFQATVHAREQLQDLEMAVAEDGKILGIRGTVYCDLGAHPHSVGVGPAWVTGVSLTGQYAITNLYCEVVAVATNKVPSSTFRGFGGPEATFATERLLDKAARALGMDPAEIRRRNHIQPDAFPWFSAGGGVFDSGNYPGALATALEAVGYDQLREEQRELRERGVHRGIGIGCYIHTAGFGPSVVLGLLSYYTSGYEGSTVKVGPDGTITVYTGMIPMGQGTETTLAQVAAHEFGVDIERVRVVWGDTSQTPYTGFGSAGSRSNVAAAAIIKAAEVVRDKSLRIAANMLEANVDDLVYEDGAAFVKGSPERRVTLAEIAEQAYLAHRLPEGEQPTLEGTYVYDPALFTIAFGCHIAVVDVDVETGAIEIVRYVVVDDAGTLINPLLIDGQIQGGLAQGIGGALLEEFVYDEDGQLLTQSFMDYLLPSIHEMPDVEIHHQVTPSPHTPGGFKGMGEAGTFPPGPALANAVSDALAPLDVEIDRMPITPNLIWSLLHR